MDGWRPCPGAGRSTRPGRSGGSVARSRSSGGSRPIDSDGVLRDALAESGVDLSLAEPTDAPTTLAIAEIDGAGAATYRFHTAETSAPSCRSMRSSARWRHARGPSISARSGSSWNRSARRSPAEIADGRRRDAGHARSELPAAGDPRPRGLSRPPRAYRATGRRRQGQHRRPRLPRAGSVACRGRRGRSSTAVPRSCS